MSLILIVDASPAVTSAADSVAGGQVTSVTIQAFDPEAADVNVVVLGDEVPRSRALAMTEAVMARNPRTTVILEGSLSPDELVAALRSGVRDIIAPGAEVSAAVATLRRGLDSAARWSSSALAEPKPASRRESRLISVVSPKGGVGKTSIATSIALGLAQDSPKQVVLVDLDLQFGDVDAVIDLSPKHTLHDVFAMPHLDSLVLKTMLTLHPTGLYVLCGAESPAANEGVSGKQVTALLDQLREQFSYVVVDTGAGLHEPTLAALECSTDAVVVTTMDVSAIRSVRREVEVLNDLGLMPATRHAVLNFASRDVGLTVRDVEATIGLPVNIVVPHAPEVRLAANHGEPLILRKRGGGPYVKAVRQLVKRIQEGPASSVEGQHKGVKVA